MYGSYKKVFEMSCRDKTIGIIVPAYNEELLIGDTLRAMPEYVRVCICR